MKNLFALDINNDENSIYKKFVTRTLDKEIEDKIEALNQKETDISKRVYGKYQLIYKISQITFYVALLAIIIALSRIAKGSFNLTIGIILGSAVLLGIMAGIVILIISKKVKKINENSTEIADLNHEREDILQEIYENMGIPSDCKHIDIFCIGEEEKKDGSKKEKGILGGSYLSFDNAIYVDEDNLYLSTSHETIAIKLDSIKEIKVINKRISFYGWNKDNGPKSPLYKPYKIVVNNNGIMFVKGYYQLIFNDEFQDYYVLIPCYEKDTIEELLDNNLFTNETGDNNDNQN